MALDAGSVLVLNCGSSSVMVALVDPETGERALTGLGERVGSDDAVVHIRRNTEETNSAPRDGSHHVVVAHLLGALSAQERAGISAVGHRVVHGGRRFTESVLVDDAVLRPSTTW